MTICIYEYRKRKRLFLLWIKHRSCCRTAYMKLLSGVSWSFSERLRNISHGFYPNIDMMCLLPSAGNVGLLSSCSVRKRICTFFTVKIILLSLCIESVMNETSVNIGFKTVITIQLRMFPRTGFSFSNNLKWQRLFVSRRLVGIVFQCVTATTSVLHSFCCMNIFVTIFSYWGGKISICNETWFCPLK
jgi:hypothetical protein